MISFPKFMLAFHPQIEEQGMYIFHTASPRAIILINHREDPVDSDCIVYREYTLKHHKTMIDHVRLLAFHLPGEENISYAARNDFFDLLEHAWAFYAEYIRNDPFQDPDYKGR